MFSDKNKIDETSGLSFIVICDNKIILFCERMVSKNLSRFVCCCPQYNTINFCQMIPTDGLMNELRGGNVIEMQIKTIVHT